MLGAETLANRGGGAACHGARLLVSTAVNDAIRRSTTLCVGSAAIKLARSVRTMLATKTACKCKGSAIFYFAHFCATTTVLATPSSCIDSRGAAEVIAEPKGTMLLAESASLSSSVAPFSRADCPSIMLLAQSSHFSVVAAAFNRAPHFGGMMETNTTLSIACVSEARIHCADPKGAMLRADKLVKNLRGVAAWSCAG